MIGKNKTTAGEAVLEYKEVQVKNLIYISLTVVILFTAPLVWLNYKTSAEGARIADASRFSTLVGLVDQNVKAVQAQLDNEGVKNGALQNVNAGPTSIIPTIIPTNMDEFAKNNGKFKIELSAIYWSSQDPIVTINHENYHTGDLVLGYRIIEIRKTEVVFEDPMGEKVVKYLYEYLGTQK